MNGAESLVNTLVACGIDTCFANPGTSEMHFVAALDRISGIRCILGLSESVVTGAADGYARIADKPAATLLHCGPGLANGMANLHNAMRANSMIVNCVGDHATYHKAYDAPLASDIEGAARTVSSWTRTTTEASMVGSDACSAVEAAMTSPGGISTLILPSDCCWNEGGKVGNWAPPPPPPQSAPPAITEAAKLLRTKKPTVILLGNKALRADAIAVAAKIAHATGAKLLAPSQNARIERGGGRYPVNRIPYPVDMAVAALKDVENFILVGAKSPVSFFAYPGKPSTPLPPGANVHVMSRPEEDVLSALMALAEEIGATEAPPNQNGERSVPATGAVTSDAFAQSLSALMPENAIIADESITFGRATYPSTHNAPVHDWLVLTGGAIGSGIPLAVGAAVAEPGRRVINIQGDGSALYSIQGLWTQARENLDVTTVILGNRKYAILLDELKNVGATPGKTALNMLGLDAPELDFVKMSQSFGVPAERATTMEEFNKLLSYSLGVKGPFLIELLA